MKRLPAFLVLAAAMAMALQAQAAEDDCIADDFALGTVLYSDISPSIRYSRHCLVPQHDGELSIIVVAADTPIEVEASRGGSSLGDTVRWTHGTREPVTREVRFPVRAGQRIDVRVDPLVRGKERHGGYRLLATTQDDSDPGRFTSLALRNANGVDLGYDDLHRLMGVITLAPDQTLKVYVPNLGKHPRLHLGVDGVDPAQLIVGTIDVSTGEARTSPLADGTFAIPMLDPKGIVLWIASKSLVPVSFRIKD